MALAAALPGLEVVGANVVRVAQPRPGTLFGPGKVEELKQVLTEAEVELWLAMVVPRAVTKWRVPSGEPKTARASS